MLLEWYENWEPPPAGGSSKSITPLSRTQCRITMGRNNFWRELLVFLRLCFIISDDKVKILWGGHEIKKKIFLLDLMLQNTNAFRISNVQILQLVYDLHYYKMYCLSFIGKSLKWWDQFRSRISLIQKNKSILNQKIEYLCKAQLPLSPRNIQFVAL